MKLKSIKQKKINYPIKKSVVAVATICTIGLSSCANKSQIKEPNLAAGGISAPVVGDVYTNQIKEK